MKSFKASLLREKFEIKKPNGKDKKPTIALGNRLVLCLNNHRGDPVERFIVRAHNMHQTTRMAARIQTEFLKRGPLLSRGDDFQWNTLWRSITTAYEQTYNTDLWGAIYHDGKPIFKAGEIHPLFDILEHVNKDKDEDDYESSMSEAEAMLKQTGQDISLDYDGNVALVINLDKTTVRFGIILRGAHRTTTFKFSVQPKKGDKGLNITQAIMSAAAYLEGIQLAFMVGMTNVKVAYGLTERGGAEDKQAHSALERIARMETELNALEGNFDVRYRPERPNFKAVETEAETFAKDIFEPAENSDYI